MHAFQPQKIASVLSNAPTILRHCRYKRFAFRHGSVLVIASGYHLINDSIRAFLRNQWGVKLLELHPAETFIARFFEAIAFHKPDFLFTINHIGFDDNGAFTRILEEIEMPFVSWFVDQPEFILLDRKKNASDWAVTPSWEKSGLEFLKKFGFSNAFYLPLAGTPERFNAHNSLTNFQYEISFVGDSLEAGAQKWRGRCESETDLVNLIDPVVERLVKNRLLKPIDLARDVSEDASRQISVATSTQLAIFSSAVCKEASKRQRQATMGALAAHGLDVFGDTGWQGQVAGKVKLHSSVDYNDELPSVYASSQINLNVTNYQMPTAVNQRVFDVPLAGGFLLTDYQADLDGLFDVKDEIASYKSLEEAEEKVCYYKAHPSACERIIRHAQARILDEHTYEKRIATIIYQVREHYRMACGLIGQVF